MARIPREVVESIRDRTDIVDVVSRHVQLQRRGASFVGLCPFHQEKTPSFHVIPGKAIYHCFGCNASGDAFRFLMEIEGVSFVEAIKELAGPAGVTIEERTLTRTERDALRQRATLYDVLEEAARFFERELWATEGGAEARAYLERRGLSVEDARSARVGWAPTGWTRLIDHLQRTGFRIELITEAGLAKPRERGDGHYDAFRERVILPIRDDRGRVIAFGGRLLEGDGPKYINSPETPLYQKSKVLYGLDAARAAIGRKGRLILVEGYFDVLSMHFAGFAETVATCGTSLTPEHVARIRRLTRSVIVLLDADEAGARAAERTLPLFEEAGIQAFRLQIPDAKDPDDLIREGGPAAMDKALAQVEPLLPWVARRKLATYGHDAAARERVRDELADMLGGLRPAHLYALAPLLKMDEQQLIAWAKTWRPTQTTRTVAAEPERAAPTGWRPHRDIVHLLWLLVHRYPYTADLVRAAHPSFLDRHGPVKPAVARLLQGESVTSLLDDEPDPGVRRTLSVVSARPNQLELDEHGAPVAAVEVLVRLATPALEAQAARLHEEAIRAGRARELDRNRALLAQLDELKRTQRAIERALAEAHAATATTARAHALREVLDLLHPIETNNDEQ